MTVAEARSSLEAPPANPTLAVAERQLVLLGELAEIAMAAARAFGSSAVASAEAEKRVLAEEWYTPEVGRARACGAKDAAESLQKVSRAVRLTLKLQMAVAEIVRDIRAGIVTHTAGTIFQESVGDTLAERSGQALADRGDLQVRRPSVGSSSGNEAPDYDRPDRDTERLYDIERPDRLPQGPFHEVVDGLCADIGVAPDWTRWRVGRPKLDYEPLRPRLPGETETRPPGSAPDFHDAMIANRSTHPPPG